MQVRKGSRSIGAWSVAIAIAGGLVVCGAWPASAEEATTLNHVFDRGCSVRTCMPLDCERRNDESSRTFG